MHMHMHMHVHVHVLRPRPAGYPPPPQASGWRDRAELIELAGPQLAKRARGTEAGDGGSDGDGAGDVSQHARLLEGLLPPYPPLEREAVKVMH